MPMVRVVQGEGTESRSQKTLRRTWEQVANSWELAVVLTHRRALKALLRAGHRLHTIAMVVYCLKERLGLWVGLHSFVLDSLVWGWEALGHSTLKYGKDPSVMGPRLLVVEFTLPDRGFGNT